MQVSLLDIGHLLLDIVHALKNLGYHHLDSVYHHLDSVWENKFVIWEWLSIGDGFWVRNEGLCLFLLSVLVPLLAKTHEVCAFFHILCELVCVSVLLCLESLLSFMSILGSLLQSYCFLFCKVPWVPRGGIILRHPI